MLTFLENFAHFSRQAIRILSTFIAALILLSNAVTAKDYSDYPQKFWDLSKDHWAYAYVSELADKNVISGYEDGSFKPNRTVSRAEWSKMMVVASGKTPTTLSGNTSYAIDYNSNDWFYGYVNSVFEYMNFYSENGNYYFKPNQAVSREDVTVSLVKLKGYNTEDIDYSYITKFTDFSSISNDLKKYIAVAVEKGLISGYDDNTFRGQDTLTRAEAATLLCKAFQLGNDNKMADVPTTPVTETKKYAENTEAKESETSVSTPTQEPEKPKATEEPKQVIEQKEEKPYVIDTLKQVDIAADFTYDGEKIYYISGMDIHSLDPYTGESKVIYRTDDLILQKTETQEKEVTKTVVVTVEDNQEDLEEDAEAEEVAEDTDEEAAENIAEDTEEVAEETIDDETKEVTKEITEIISEEVVVEEYSSYAPTQIKYDEYNDRLIMTGYYKNHEKAFQTPNNNARYYVVYDITNDEIFWEVGRSIEETYGRFYIDDLYFKGFLSKNKAIFSYSTASDSSYESHFINTDDKTMINRVNGTSFCWSVGKDLYGVYDYFLEKYDFSDGSFKNLFKFPTHNNSYANGQVCLGVNGENVYYWHEGAVNKLNLSSGKTSELSITTDSEYCDVLDMTKVSVYNFQYEFIPVSDTYFVFYDTAAKAFRVLSENK